MLLNVKVIPSAKKNSIREEGGVYKVHLNAPAVDGKANKALIDLLAGHFKVRKSQVQIIKGLKSRHKTINISTIN